MVSCRRTAPRAFDCSRRLWRTRRAPRASCSPRRWRAHRLRARRGGNVPERDGAVSRLLLLSMARAPGRCRCPSKGRLRARYRPTPTGRAFNMQGWVQPPRISLTTPPPTRAATPDSRPRQIDLRSWKRKRCSQRATTAPASRCRSSTAKAWCSTAAIRPFSPAMAAMVIRSIRPSRP